MNAACSTGPINLEAMEEQEPLVPTRKFLLTSLGFHGHTSCFDTIRANIIDREGDIECIEVSPQICSDYNYCDPCQRLDACYMRTCSVHLGLGSIEKQAGAVVSVLKKHGVTNKDEIILLGHSQGGLISVEFWRQFHEEYNIKGIVTMSAPLQGASLIRSLGTVDLMREANQLLPTEPSYFARCLTYCFPYCIVPCFKKLGWCCCAGLTDLAPDSSLIRKHEEVYKEMRTKKVSFLAIQAQQFNATNALPPSRQARTEFLLSGSPTAYNDGLIATESQIPHIDWSQLNCMTVKANHGMAYIPGYPVIFTHSTSQSEIRKFCNESFLDTVRKKS